MSAVSVAPPEQKIPWWLILLEGIALVILGILWLASPSMATAVVVRLLGIYWLIAGVFFSIGGLLVGTVAGGLIGKSVDLGVDQKFIKEVSEDLQPGTSAIFFIVREGNPEVAVAALKPYKGTVRHTSFPPEAEDELRRILKKRI